MATVNFPVPESRAWTCLTDEELRAVARSLFIAVDMLHASEGDYKAAVVILRELYNFGRARGMRESGSGCMG
jgi:hypothetical protein